MTQTLELCPEYLHDFATHKNSWRNAIVTARDFGCEGSEDPDADRSYWNHELRAFDRAFALLPDLTALTSEVERLRAALVKGLTANNRMVTALKQCGNQFAFYATVHTAAGKLEKADTNQRFADIARAALEGDKAHG